MENKVSYLSELSTKAQKEIAVSWDWYEERLKGLGDRFVHEVKGTIFKVTQNPKRYPPKYNNYRQTAVDTFPFVIIFQINERKKLVRIISVFHTSRQPNKKY